MITNDEEKTRGSRFEWRAQQLGQERLVLVTKTMMIMMSRYDFIEFIIWTEFGPVMYFYMIHELEEHARHSLPQQIKQFMLKQNHQPKPDIHVLYIHVYEVTGLLDQRLGKLV